MKAKLSSAVVILSIVLASILAYCFRSKIPFDIRVEKNIMGLDDLMVILSIGIENI